MSRLTTRAYLEAQGCTFEQKAQSLVSLCPFHNDHHPSLHLYQDGHYNCFGCGTWGTLFGAINFFEFGNKDDAETWSRVYARARELNGGEQLSQERARPYRQEYEPPPAPTEEEITLMTAAMHWWHKQLWSQDSWAQSARGRTSFEQRGVDSSTFSRHVQIGWAPPYDKEHYNQMFLSFSFALRVAFGRDWQSHAKKLGLLWPRSGTLALTDRMMLCCVNNRGQCIFFQGRAVVNPPKDATGKPSYPKYMSPWKIRKAPFTLPITGPTCLPGTIHTESYFGPAVLEKYAIRSYGWAGAKPSWYGLDGIEGPHWLGQDHDEPHADRSGNIYYPGHKQAEAFIPLCEEAGERYARILPSREAKDMDTWVRSDVTPLLQATQPYIDQWHHSSIPVLVPSI